MMEPYFLNNPYHSQMVYENLKRLSAEAPSYIVGLDLGHGETLAYGVDPVKMAAEGGRPKRLQMDNDGSFKIPTMIYYRGNQGGGEKIVIGAKAKKYDFIQDFKCSPSRWADRLRGHTHRELMRDFIHVLWEQLLKYNPQVESAAAQNQLLISVGCPSSPSWTSIGAMGAYTELIAEATGCPKVLVMPESTAAIMSAILCADEMRPKVKLKLHKGIVVFDAGSSTLDFTYVRLGEKMIIRSLALGGYELDNQMLETALEESGATRAQVPEEQVDNLLVKIRDAKETFYPDMDGLGVRTERTWGRNAQGKADKSIRGDLEIAYNVSSGFMQKTLSRQAIQLDSLLSPKRSWLQHCEAFVNTTKGLIGTDSNGRPLCDKVIVTGGTSSVYELMEAIRNVYGKDIVIQSNDPSTSVVKGLCYAKCLELNGIGQIEPYRAATGQKIGAHYDAFLNEMSLYITEIVCDRVKDAVGSLAAENEKIKVAVLVDTINEAVRADPRLTGEEAMRKVEGLFIDHFKSAQTDILEEVNRVSTQLYGATLSAPPQIPLLSDKELTALVDSLNLAGTINAAWAYSVVPAVLFDILFTILLTLGIAMMGTALAPLGVATELFAIYAMDNQNFKEKVMRFLLQKNFSLSRWQMNQIVRHLTVPKKRQKIITDAAEKTLAANKKKELLKQEFVPVLEQQAEIALGKVLFLVFDEKPDYGS